MPALTPPLRILHLFDRYLNSTMNWAYRLIRNTPDVQVFIGAGVIFDNAFRDPAFQYILPYYQSHLPPDEWHIPGALGFRARADRFVFNRYQRQLIRAIKRSDIQLLHAHFAQVGCYALPVAAEAGVPLVVSFYGMDYESIPYRKPRYRERYRDLFREAAALVCEGPHGAAALAEMGCPPEKIQVVPLGLALDAIQPLDRNKPAGQLRLLQAATFTEKKGHRYTIQALAAALSECPGIHLTLAGEKADPHVVRDVLRLIDEWGLQSRVEILDFVPFDRFYAWLGDFDICIHPSCYAANRDCEGGAPVVLLDVQATGMPVISTTHCDIPFEVIHEQTGLLCAERDVEALSRAIIRFCRMGPEEYRAFSMRARNHMLQHFDIRQSGRQIGSLYRTFV